MIIKVTRQVRCSLVCLRQTTPGRLRVARDHLDTTAPAQRGQGEHRSGRRGSTYETAVSEQ